MLNKIPIDINIELELCIVKKKLSIASLTFKIYRKLT